MKPLFCQPVIFKINSILISIFLLFILPINAFPASKSEVINRNEQDQYKDWIPVRVDISKGKEAFSMKIPPNMDNFECAEKSKKGKLIVCEITGQDYGGHWYFKEFPDRFLAFKFNGYPTDHMKLKESMTGYSLRQWKSKSARSYSKLINDQLLYFQDKSYTHSGKGPVTPTTRTIYFETEKRFFVTFSISEGLGRESYASSVPITDWKYQHISDKILNSIHFSKDLGTKVDLPEWK